MPRQVFVIYRPPEAQPTSAMQIQRLLRNARTDCEWQVVEDKQPDSADAECQHDWVGLHGHPAALECKRCGALRR